MIGGGSSAPDWAAFSNGVHIRYLDCNDTYLSLEPAHPSDNWAAVMAAGQLAGADGKAWIAAAAVAYEVQCRLCDAASIRARGWDHTTYGSISATLAAAMLLKLTHEQTVHALGIAATTGTALRLTRAGELSMWKGCAFAYAARNGVFAALLAADGMTGPAPLFEGDMGFFQQVSGPFTLAKLGGPSAADWMLPKTSIKFVPAEYHSQSAIAAAFDLRPQIGDPTRIREIEIATFRTAVEIIGKDPEKWRPKTRETADHSLPYCTAVALVDGKVTAEQFTAERLRRPRPARPGRAHPRRRRPEAHRRLSRRDPQPRDRHARRRPKARRRGRVPSRPRPATRSPTPSSPSSSTAWSTRSWAAPAPIRSSSASPGSNTTRPRTKRSSSRRKREPHVQACQPDVIVAMPLQSSRCRVTVADRRRSPVGLLPL